MLKLTYSILTFALVTACDAPQNPARENELSQDNKLNKVEQSTPKVKTILSDQLQPMLDEENVVIIDVRTATEISEGFIEGADEFINVNDPDFSVRIDELDKSKTYVMYCRSGARSGRAAQMMIERGFLDVYNLKGGIMAYKGTVVTE